MTTKKGKNLYSNIKQLIDEAKKITVQNVNTTLVFTNYHIGKMIVEDEQQGKKRASYAEQTLKNLSKKLTKDFGKGYSVDNLQYMRNFYLLYNNRVYETVSRKSEIMQTPSAQLEKYATVSRKSLIPKSQRQNELSIRQTVFAKFQFHFPLSWSHYFFLMKINNEEERNFYEIESSSNNWSVRELQRQYNTSLFERLSVSKNKKAIRALSRKG